MRSIGWVLFGINFRPLQKIEANWVVGGYLILGPFFVVSRSQTLAATYRPPQLGWVLEQVLYGQSLATRDCFFRETTALGFCGPEDVSCLPKRSREDRCTYGTSTSIGAASSTDHQSDSELSAASDDDGKS